MDKTLQMDIADAVIDRPKGFSVGRRHFCLYPLTLGKMYLTQRVMQNLGVDYGNLKVNPYAEALRLANTKRDDCLALIAYHSLKDKEQVLNTRTVATRKGIFGKELDESDIATLLMMCIMSDRTHEFIHELGIDKELQRMNEVLKAKQSNNTFQFGGKSVYGTLIDNACERYGWTFDYVVWGISYTNLQMLLKDSVKSVYLTDDEMKKCGIRNKRNIIDGNDQEAMMEVIRSHSWK